MCILFDNFCHKRKIGAECSWESVSCNCSLSSSDIRRALYGEPGPVQYVSVNHGSGNIGVTQQFLHRANVITRFKKMGGFMGSDLKIELLTPSGIFAILMPWQENLGLNTKAPFITLSHEATRGRKYSKILSTIRSSC
jgi:hypothetical protein